MEPASGQPGPLTQSQLDELAEKLDIIVELTDNQAQRYRDGTILGADKGSIYTFDVIIHNKSSVALPASGWQLYIPSIQRLLHATSEYFTVEPVTGDMHLLNPTQDFPGLPVDESLTITLVGETYILQQSEFLPRWYLVSEPLEPRVLAATDSAEYPNFVKPFTAANFAAKPAEQTRRITAETRYELNQPIWEPAVDPDSLSVRVVPKPLQASTLTGPGVDIESGLVLKECDQRVSPPTRDWWASRAASLGIQFFDISDTTIKTYPETYPARAIPITVRVTPTALPPEISKSEGYQLRVDAEEISIDAFDAAGANHAIMTVLGLLPAPNRDQGLPRCLIQDAPRYQHRAVLIDISRNFYGPGYLKKLIDQLAVYKLNVLHLQLTNDEGWRLEIPGLPELTRVGSRRGFTTTEQDCLFSQLGSGPDRNNSGSGFLRRDEFIDLLRYANARGVSVLPEFNMPGHSRAAVISMEARYHRLKNQGASPEEAAQFRLIDPDDNSNVLTVQHYGRDSMLNPAAPGSYRFAQHVINQVKRMYAEAEVALLAWHSGGDEVSNILLTNSYCDYRSPRSKCGIIDQRGQDQPWQHSPIAASLTAETPGLTTDATALSTHFAGQLSRILSSAGISRQHLWHDLFETSWGANARGPQTAEVGVEPAWARGANPGDYPGFSTSVVAEVWAPISKNATRTILKLQERGLATLGAAPDFVYFDGPYEADPAEPGTTWATRALDERTVFSYPPDNPPQAAAYAVGRFGNRYTSTSDGTIRPMFGIQAQLFTETTRTETQADYLLFPRLLAFAERAWHRAGWELEYQSGASFGPSGNSDIDSAAIERDYREFATIVGTRELAKLDKAGVCYRVPPPGIRIESDGTIQVNASFPGLAIRVSLDDGQTWSAPETIKAGPGAVIMAVASSADRCRISRATRISGVARQS